MNTINAEHVDPVLDQEKLEETLISIFEQAHPIIEGLRGDLSVAELCRKEGISQSLYYKWSKEFLEAGKERLAGDIRRKADGTEVKEMRGELEQLKLLVAELSLKNRVLKKSLLGLGNGKWKK